MVGNITRLTQPSNDASTHDAAGGVKIKEPYNLYCSWHTRYEVWRAVNVLKRPMTNLVCVLNHSLPNPRALF